MTIFKVRAHKICNAIHIGDCYLMNASIGIEMLHQCNLSSKNIDVLSDFIVSIASLKAS